MRILVTGASGLIGTQLCNHLLSKGHSLHILTTRSPWQVENEQTQIFKWAPQNNEIDSRALEGVDAVINLAPKSAVELQRPTRYLEKIIDRSVL